MSDEDLRANARMLAPVRTGRPLAAFALLLALAALTLAGYQFYQGITGGSSAGPAGVTEALRVEQQRQAEQRKRISEAVARLETPPANEPTAAAMETPAQSAAKAIVAIPDRTLKL